MDRSTFIGWTGPEYLNYRVFYQAQGYKSETVVRATSEEHAKAIMMSHPNCVAITSVFKGR